MKFSSRIFNNRTNGLHERALSLAYSYFSSTFSYFLIKDKSVTIHQRNLRILAFEMFKVKNNLAPEVMKNIFSFKTLPLSLRNSTTLQCRST